MIAARSERGKRGKGAAGEEQIWQQPASRERGGDLGGGEGCGSLKVGLGSRTLHGLSSGMPGMYPGGFNAGRKAVRTSSLIISALQVIVPKL